MEGEKVEYAMKVFAEGDKACGYDDTRFIVMRFYFCAGGDFEPKSLPYGDRLDEWYVRAQASFKKDRPDEKSYFYGYNLSTNHEGKNVYQLRDILKTGESLQRKLDKLSESLGTVQSLGEFIARIAHVLKIKKFYRVKAKSGWDVEWHITDISGIQHYIEKTLFDWIDEMNPKPKSEAC